jgi:hypothetical protein
MSRTLLVLTAIFICLARGRVTREICRPSTRAPDSRPLIRSVPQSPRRCGSCFVFNLPLISLAISAAVAGPIFFIKAGHAGCGG